MISTLDGRTIEDIRAVDLGSFGTEKLVRDLMDFCVTIGNVNGQKKSNAWDGEISDHTLLLTEALAARIAQEIVYRGNKLEILVKLVDDLGG